MADRSSGDYPADINDGAIEAQQENLNVASLEGARRGEYRRRARPPRTPASRVRLTAAGQRDAIADARDMVARARDRAAEARDLASAQQDAVDQQVDGLQPTAGADDPATGLRERAAARRAEAAEQRSQAAEDRLAAARDREQAAFERRHALTDRESFVRQLAASETDSLTGARTRVAGLVDLDRELDRCRRAGAGVVVALVEVASVETTEGGPSDAARDELLKRVVALTRAHLRSYDLIIRLDSDELLCAMSNTSVPDARARFDQLTADLAVSAEAGVMTVGLAEFTGDETPTELIARADRELLNGLRGDDVMR